MREAREEELGALRQRCKTTPEALTTAAERPIAERGQTQPAEDCQGPMGTGSDQPPYFGRI